MKVSVIVPVYNVEPYLDKCLNTLVNQTLKKIEIIIVNDGSKDNSEKIIEKYLKKYPEKIKYIKKANGGLSSARNEGLKYASGEYIGFVDSDDYVSLNTFNLMYKKAKEKNFDLVVCNLNYVYEKKTKMVSAGLDKDLENEDEVKKNIVFLYPAVWNKLYKKEILDSLKFKEGIWYEDVEFNFRVYPRVKSIGYVDKPLIQYVQRESSISKTIDKRLFNYVDNFNGLIRYYQDNNLYNKYYFELEYSYVRYLYATFIKQLSYTNDKELFKEGVKEAIKNVQEHFPNYKKNIYLKKFGLKNIYLKTFNKKTASLLNFKNRRK